MIDIIETALTLNNSVTLTKIPYDYLTRKETIPLIPIDKLSMKIQMMQYAQPYVHYNIEDTLKLNYQVMCKDHVKDLLENFDIIYVSMEHLADAIKEHHKDFYYSDMYKQFHLTFQLLDWDDEGLHVEILNLNAIEFIKHQHIARNFETNFNIKHNIKKYITCPCCFPTIVATGLYYKEMNGKLPTKLAMIDERFEDAMILIKNDRINIENIFKVSQLKWKCFNCDDYEKKMKWIGEKYKWDFDPIVKYLHKNHYEILKSCERVRDNSSNGDWKTRNPSFGRSSDTSSPSWRSKITV